MNFWLIKYNNLYNILVLMVKFLTLAEFGEQIIKETRPETLLAKVAAGFNQCIEFAPDKAALDVKKIPGINDVIEEEDENES